MMAMAVDINEAPKGEDLSVSRGCKHKEDKEPEPIMVEGRGGG